MVRFRPVKNMEDAGGLVIVQFVLPVTVMHTLVNGRGTSRIVALVTFPTSTMLVSAFVASHH